MGSHAIDPYALIISRQYRVDDDEVSGREMRARMVANQVVYDIVRQRRVEALGEFLFWWHTRQSLAKDIRA